MAEFRFFAELNDFLAPALRGRVVRRAAAPHETLKHVVETLGVPHTEIGRATLDGHEVSLDIAPLHAQQHVTLYPPWRRLAPPPADDRPPRFAVDAHLARLARLLRLAGFDTLLHEQGPDDELVQAAAVEGRVVLTRDRALLMHRHVVHGAYVWSPDPRLQLVDVASRFGLDLLQRRAPARCMLCNAVPVAVPLGSVIDQVPPRTAACIDAYWRCPSCHRVYWHGSHWRRMQQTLAVAQGQAQGPASA